MQMQHNLDSYADADCSKFWGVELILRSFIFAAVAAIVAVSPSAAYDVRRTDTDHFLRSVSDYLTLAKSMIHCGQDPSPYLQRMMHDLRDTQYINAEGLPAWAEAKIAEQLEIFRRANSRFPDAWGATDEFPLCSVQAIELSKRQFENMWPLHLKEFLRHEDFLADHAKTVALLPPEPQASSSSSSSSSGDWQFFTGNVHVEGEWRGQYDEGNGTYADRLKISDDLDTYTITCREWDAAGNQFVGTVFQWGDETTEEFPHSAARYLADERGSTGSALAWAEACTKHGMI